MAAKAATRTGPRTASKAAKSAMPRVEETRDAADEERQAPSLGALELARRVARGEYQPRARGMLAALAVNPPQVMLFEGANAAGREAVALYWAAALNCPHGPGAPSSPSSDAPCLECPTCEQIFSGVHRDLFFLDGRVGSIQIEQARAIRAVLGEPPRGDGYRAVILVEAQALTVWAANALLKSLEEPRFRTSFSLLAPQRERLLPTLVSRSWVLTLDWRDTADASQVSLAPDAATPGPDPQEPDQATGRVLEWRDALLQFLRTGAGWMSRTVVKNAVDRELAAALILDCQRDLCAVLRRAPNTDLGRVLSERLDAAGLRRLDVALAQCEEALAAGAAPALVLDWMATSLYQWISL